MDPRKPPAGSLCEASQSGQTMLAQDAVLAALLPAVRSVVGAIIDCLAPEIERLLDERLSSQQATDRSLAPDPWLTTEQASRHLQLSCDALRARARRGTVPAHRDGDRWLYHRDELDAHLRGYDAASTSTEAPATASTVRGRGSKEETLEAV